MRALAGAPGLALAQDDRRREIFGLISVQHKKERSGDTEKFLLFQPSGSAYNTHTALSPEKSVRAERGKPADTTVLDA